MLLAKVQFAAVVALAAFSGLAAENMTRGMGDRPDVYFESAAAIVTLVLLASPRIAPEKLSVFNIP